MLGIRYANAIVHKNTGKEEVGFGTETVVAMKNVDSEVVDFVSEKMVAVACAVGKRPVSEIWFDFAISGNLRVCVLLNDKIDTWPFL